MKTPTLSDETPPEESIRKRAMAASGWIAIRRPAMMIVQLGRNIVLTRLLFPEAFGLMALVAVVMQGMQMLTDVGINASVIRSERTDQAFMRTAWTLQVLRGLLLTALCAIFAEPLAYAIAGPAKAQQLAGLLPLASFVLAIGGFRSANHIASNRDLKIGRLTIIHTFTAIASLVITVGLAAAGMGVLALVWGNLANAVIGVGIEFLLLKGVTHRFELEGAAVREQMGLGTWIFLSTMLTFGANQIDSVMLGRLVSLEMIGFYSIAFVLSTQPKELAFRFATSVLFPAISEKARKSGGDFRGAFHKSRAVLLGASSFIVVGVAIFGPLFFELLYDPRYEPSGWMSRWLCIPVWAMILFGTKDRALITLGAGRYLAASNAVRLVGSALGVYLGHKFAGLPGLIVGLSIGSFLGTGVVTLGLVKAGLTDLRNDFVFSGWTLVASIVGILAIEGVNQIPTLSNAAHIGLSIALGAVVLAVHGYTLVLALGAMPHVRKVLGRFGLARVAGALPGRS